MHLWAVLATADLAVLLLSPQFFHFILLRVPKSRAHQAHQVNRLHLDALVWLDIAEAYLSLMRLLFLIPLALLLRAQG